MKMSSRLNGDLHNCKGEYSDSDKLDSSENVSKRLINSCERKEAIAYQLRPEPPVCLNRLLILTP